MSLAILYILFSASLGLYIPIKIIFGIMEILDRIIPVFQVFWHIPFNILLVGPLTKSVLWYMWLILVLINSSLLSQYVISLGPFMIGYILVLLLVGQHAVSPRLILAGDPGAHVAIRIQNKLLGLEYFYMGCISFLFFFILQDGQEVAPLLVWKGVIVLVFVVHFILHGYRTIILSSSTDFIFSELLVVDIPILLVGLIPLLQRWR